MKVLGCLFAVSMLAISACSPGSSPGQSSTDSRARLNSNNSYKQFGDYVIHVSAISTADLTPDIAQNYGIVRSENQALVNLVVLKKTGEIGVDMPVSANVSMTASNLTGQLKNTELAEIVDGASIYYIGQTAVDDRETINFDFDVQPAGSDQALLIRFTHQFYTR
jgi:hypothetical protein